MGPVASLIEAVLVLFRASSIASKDAASCKVDIGGPSLSYREVFSSSAEATSRLEAADADEAELPRSSMSPFMSGAQYEYGASL